MSASKPIVPTSSESVFSQIDALTTLQKNAIIRPDNPPPGIAGFVFDIVTEDGAELTADITDHYVEDNSAIQDHIALKPEIVTVRGLVGELRLTQAQIDAIGKVVETLPLNPDLSPSYDAIGQNQIDAMLKEDALSPNASMTAPSLARYYQWASGAPGSSAAAGQGANQSTAFGYFYQLWKSRERFTVETPWGFFTDMVIQALRATQGEESKYVSDFVLTFKHIRTVNELEFKPGQIAGRAGQQSAKPISSNVLGDTEPPSTIAYGLLKAFAG